MLPAPALSHSRTKRKLTHTPLAHYRFDRAFLLARSRATNLAVFFLAGSLLVSILVHIQSLLQFSSPERTSIDGRHADQESRRIPRSIYDTLSRGVSQMGLHHLIIVAGHAVWTGCSSEQRKDEEFWILEERQRGGGNIEAFFGHIEQGVRMAVADNSSLLVFSGGQTRPGSLITEAQSYHQLAVASHLLESPGDSTALPASKRVVSESFALDSFQNLLFSLARFREVTGLYPRKITVVGFGMKKRRFVELHRKAIRWPESDFQYVGLDVTGDNSIAYAGENQFGYTPYSKDLYGCHDELLAKRRRRNPFQVFHPYHTSAPEMAGLFEWCPLDDGRNEIYPGWLPWAV